MRRVGIALIAAGGLSMAAPAAWAGDLVPYGVPAIYQPPPPIFPLNNWTGFYIGGHFGWAWTDKKWHDGLTGAELENFTANGLMGGVQGGYNWQIGRWVIGVEAQASWGRIHNGADWTDPFFDPVLPRKRTETTVLSFGTVAARFGYAWDRSLIYVKGGAAWVNEVYRAFDATTVGITGPLLGSASHTRWGWMVGIGHEYAFLGNWSATLEFDWLGFGTDRITLTGLGFTRGFDVEQNIALIKGGINYRFGGPIYPW